jgi:LPS O-antigen subunit length determinant protein (WzzB/FepE family)
MPGPIVALIVLSVLTAACILVAISFFAYKKRQENQRTAPVEVDSSQNDTGVTPTEVESEATGGGQIQEQEFANLR